MTPKTINLQTLSNPAFGRAVVIGSGIAGLTAARVLADYFTEVTIIERDSQLDIPQIRRGVPQAHHAHSLPVRGQQLLEKQFPGLTAELISQGAEAVHGGSEMAVFVAGEYHQMRQQAGLLTLSSSRPLLESAIYRRVAAHPRVRILSNHGVEALLVDRSERRIIGVRLRCRGGWPAQEATLAADVVLDASGRDSQAPQWLADLGYTPPLESVVNAFTGYSSRLYRRPVNFGQSWKTLYVRPTPHHSTRGGVILPIEGDRWHVTLHGMAGDHPPTSEAGFLAFARSLAVPQFYEALCAAEPLTEPRGYRRTENRARHYERLPRHLEGLLVCGDAVFTLNPVHAMGMTAAVLGSLALDKTLQAHGAADLTGLAGAFQQRLSRTMTELWNMTTGQDRRWPQVEVTEPLEQARRERRRAVATIAQGSTLRRDRTSSSTGLNVAFT
ncbi:MAG: 2-polyprenyl-6-methoxyphenol hydroxylase-like oxidoreductase [Anaerolineales bacterium]|nr:2-polyprenyl-6-methoxyphenol hydroxylase-like oxidoreductase [Anaerolineales bacterium]